MEWEPRQAVPTAAELMYDMTADQRYASCVYVFVYVFPTLYRS